MDKPRINTSVLYTIVANAMPMEGRDFTIDSAFGENNKPKLIITPLTAVGRGFVPVLIEQLSAPMSAEGFTIDTKGAVAAEVATIASIRKKVEEEAAAALNRKIAAAEADLKAKAKAVNDAVNAQKTGNDKTDLVNATRAARNAADTASRSLETARRVLAKIGDVRKEIDAAALSAAKDDAKNGKSWAVDMDAPLTSLFDTQDVTDKFKSRERLVEQLATKEVEMEDIKASAVHTTKQYIMPKEG